LMSKYNIVVAEVQGHNDRYASTVCPGWDQMNWRADFYAALNEETE